MGVHLQISSHRVIYHLLEEVNGWAQALTPKVEKEVVSGEADVLQVRLSLLQNSWSTHSFYICIYDS